jgi:hypothetical protein
MTFEVTDPKQVTVSHEGSGQFEFVCGPMQKFHVSVDYLPDTSLGQGVAGALKAIRF